MWTEIALLRRTLQPAEKGPILHCFSTVRLTGSDRQHCYTFEYFASDPDVIRIPYYYLYKKNKNHLKEETTWS